MAQRKVTAFVDSQERLTEDVYSMWIREEEMAAKQSRDSLFLCIQRTEQNCFRARSASVRRIKKPVCCGSSTGPSERERRSSPVTRREIRSISWDLSATDSRWRKQQRERPPS